MSEPDTPASQTPLNTSKHESATTSRLSNASIIINIIIAIIGVRLIYMQVISMERQTGLLDLQIKLSTRPSIVTEVLPANKDAPFRTGPWVIKNIGKYAIKNIKYQYIHFKKYLNHGWMMGATNQTVTKNKSLDPGESISENIEVLSHMFKNITPPGFTPVAGAEFVMIFLTFDRDGDGKRYLYMEPFEIASTDGKANALTSYGGLSSPLAKACTLDAYATELAIVYLKRNPSPVPLEMYNYNYMFGVPDIKCLLPIDWKN